MASQGTHPQNINDFDFLMYDSTLGDGSLNTTSDSLNDTFVNVHFQQHEYDHDGGQNVQSDAMFNIDLTRFNKIATQGAPQMAVDKEANSLSRVYSYYSKFNLRLFYV